VAKKVLEIVAKSNPYYFRYATGTGDLAIDDRLMPQN
jgi:hypothetical protein